ncbi:MAG: CDP-alcohol phosphatidyltransferase family protein [Pseudomonadota bacterium]|nr:CDP-alcohol phosphatidyltransferase family protein [Pseudomonadota bacterium]
MNHNKPYWNLWTWPNAITISRLVLGIFGAFHALEIINVGKILTPVFSNAADLFARYSVAVGGTMITLAIAGDALDGYVARKTNSVSRFGEFVDPLVDKLLFWIAIGVILLVQTTFPATTFLLLAGVLLIGVLLYDIWSLNNHFKNSGGAVSSGKIKSFLLNLSLLACFVNLVLHDAMPDSTNMLVMYGGFLIAALLVLRAIPYLYTSWASRSK